MPKLPVYVIRRKGSRNLYWMRDIPPHARFLFRTEKGLRKQIWKSLKTNVPKIAATRAAEHNAWFDGVLSKVSDANLSVPRMSGANQETLIIAIIDDQVRKVKNGDLHDLEEADWRKYELGDFIFNKPENNLSRHLSSAEAIAFFKFGALEGSLEDSKFLVGDYDADLQTLNGIIEKCRRTIHNKKDSDNPTDKIAYLQAELDLEIAHQTLTKMQGRRENLSPEYADENLNKLLDKIISSQNKITIGGKVAEYLADPLSRKSERHISTSKARIGSFVEFVGSNTPLETITKQDILNFRKTVLEYLPVRAPNHLRTNQQRMALVKRGQAQPLAAKTKNLYINSLSAFFHWCVKMDYLEKNPVLPFRYPEHKAKRKERRGFTAGELTKLFGDEWAASEKTKPHQYWIPLIGLFHGCRLREICQLRGKDVLRKDGVLGFRITGNVDLGTSVKNEASDRSIPIHKTLIALGFADYCKKIKDDAKLFPQLPEREDGAPAFGKWFRRYKEQCGVGASGLDFHSFRHGYREACREAGLPYDVVCRIGGWKMGESPEAAYGNANFKRLYKELAKLKYGVTRLER